MERVDQKLTTPRWIINESVCRYEFASRFIRNKIVIDAACGTGYGEEILLKNKPKKIFAFDISKKSIKEIKKRYKDLNEWVNFQIADIIDMPLPDHSVDVFISLETIEHVKNSEKYLLEIKRVLKNNGIFICSTPNRSITNPGMSINQKPFNPYHNFEYSKKEFTEILNKFFKRVKLYGQNIYSVKNARQLKSWAIFTSTRLIIKFRQLSKLPFFFLDPKHKRKVKKLKPGQEPEYLIAVCKIF